MLHLVYGRTGSGKSEWIYRHMEKTAQSHRVFLLVPDREAVAAESRISELAGAGNMDVLTFRRLCNYVFRRYGGLCTDYIEPGAKKLIMRNVLRTLAPALHEYGAAGAGSRGLCEKLCATRTELYQNKIAPADLDRVRESLEQGDPLREKTSDLALIFSAFDAEVSARFSDPDGMLERAATTLAGGAFFHGTTVYLDSFLSFSAQQYEILREIFRGADEVYLSLAFLPDEDGGDASCLFLRDTERRVLRLASRTGTPVGKGVYLYEAPRYQSRELAFLSAGITGTARVQPTWRDIPQDIRLIRAANAFAESEAVAADICRRVREGARYRDLAVIVRDTARYTGITDAIFRKYEIPYFLSAKKEIREKPLIRYIFSAFAVCERGFCPEDVIALTKTGLSGLTPAECDLFENYIVKWNIRGRTFTDDAPWSMSPSGYGAPSAAELDTLARLAEIRGRVIPPLKAFAATYRIAATVREKAAVLFDFLSEREVPTMLVASAEAAKTRGDLADAAETIQLWNVFCGALDQLVSACGDTEADMAEFSQMLLMVLSETEIGKIPTSIDEVTICDASQALSGSPTTVYLLGANEGVFPKKIVSGGLFSEAEKEALAEAGVEITNRRERAVSEELYYFCRAASMPSQSLVVTFSHYGLAGDEERPSIGVKRIKAIFPQITVEDYELATSETLLEGRGASFEYVNVFSGNLGRALREYYEEIPEYAEKMRYRTLSLSAANERLSEEAAKELFGEKLKTSYSRLETYIKCEFCYFCEYELRLRDRMPAKFGAVDIGTFLHGILEETVKWIAENGDEAARDEVLRARIETIARAYTESVFRTDLTTVPPRIRHVLRYLCRSAEVFAKRLRAEFAVSGFRPCDFELTVGVGGAIPPMRLQDENTEVELRGKIDRVDAYEGGDGKLYIRVVDYKTGEKTFERKNIALGLDMQMLLYLFSVWQNGAAHYGGREIVPAGVLYAGIKPPQTDVAFGASSGGEQATIRTSGLFLRDEAILRAMDPALKGEWIPVKAGDLTKEKASLIGLDAFSALADEVSKTVLRYAKSLSTGAAHAKPLVVGKKSPCEYCKMRPVCRAAKK